MNDSLSFQDFLTNQGPKIEIFDFGVNLCLSALLAMVLAYIYVHYGTSLSNRRILSRTLILITITTMIIITVVKSSLALSLGLVGALSIVRFRAAIKEPEELAYLFISISLGLGLGANQRIVAILGTVFLIIIIWIMKYANNDEKLNNLHIEVEFVQNSKSTLNSLVEILKSYCLKVDLKRFDHIENKVSAVFTVAFDDYENIEKVVKELKLLDKKVSLSFFEI